MEKLLEEKCKRIRIKIKNQNLEWNYIVLH